MTQVSSIDALSPQLKILYDLLVMVVKYLDLIQNHDYILVSGELFQCLTCIYY